MSKIITTIVGTLLETVIGWAFGVSPLRLSGWVFVLEADKWAFFAE